MADDDMPDDEMPDDEPEDQSEMQGETVPAPAEEDDGVAHGRDASREAVER